MGTYNEQLTRYMGLAQISLRDTFPEIQRLEALDDLHDLTLVTQKSELGMLRLNYEASAPSLFPAVRQRLLDEGIAKRHNMIYKSIINKGTPEEIYKVTMVFYGSKLQIRLDVHR